MISRHSFTFFEAGMWVGELITVIKIISECMLWPGNSAETHRTGPVPGMDMRAGSYSAAFCNREKERKTLGIATCQAVGDWFSKLQKKKYACREYDTVGKKSEEARVCDPEISLSCMAE